LTAGRRGVGQPGAGQLSIGQLARRSGLSRGTLLYYDRLGLLRPSARSAAGYRRYSQADATRLAWICRYRRAGLSLATIRDLTEAGEHDRATALTGRLAALNEELRRLRAQQRFIVDLLGGDSRYESMTFLSRRRFLDLFDLAGVTEGQRERWHAAFERIAGDEHAAFLEFLGLSEQAADRVRRAAAAGPAAASPGAAMPAPAGVSAAEPVAAMTVAEGRGVSAGRAECARQEWNR
jgi:DNA-binding transcriptional MerR regulator